MKFGKGCEQIPKILKGLSYEIIIVKTTNCTSASVSTICTLAQSTEDLRLREVGGCGQRQILRERRTGARSDWARSAAMKINYFQR
jgi:hypothetical protein